MLIESAAVHWWEVLESLTKSAAIIGAGGFFLWKAVSGANNPNLAVAVTSDRSATGDGANDVVGVSVTVTRKSAVTALRLHGIALRVVDPTANRSESAIIRPVILDTTRKTAVVRKDDPLSKLKWKRLAKQPGIYVVPGDEMSFGHSFNVSRNRPCLIEVVVFGKGPFMTTVMQWRGATVSLPRAT